MKTYQRILFSSLLIIGVLGFHLAYAQPMTGPLVPCGRAGQPDCTLCHLWNLGSNIINFITFNLSIPVAFILFVVAGVLFLISGGNEQRLALAKTVFFDTLIGLVIIFCSWLLIDTLFQLIASGGDFSWAWNAFPTCSP